jgi:hypothetical protein
MACGKERRVITDVEWEQTSFGSSVESDHGIAWVGRYATQAG